MPEFDSPQIERHSKIKREFASAGPFDPFHFLSVVISPIVRSLFEFVD